VDMIYMVKSINCVQLSL